MSIVISPFKKKIIKKKIFMQKNILPTTKVPSAILVQLIFLLPARSHRDFGLVIASKRSWADAILPGMMMHMASGLQFE